MPFIEVDGVRKTFTRGSETLLVLDGLTLAVEKGEFLCLMGPSGSGKSTLLNLLAGLDSADEGHVRIDNEDIARFSEKQLARWRSTHVGFVFQFYNLLPVLTALENVALPLSLFPMARKEQKERAMYALEAVGLKDRIDHFPSQLSGGQEQRVAIARALVTDPSLIVADEPTGDLDRASAEDILALLRELHSKFQKTIVMVTHDATAAKSASRLVVLDKGKLKTPTAPIEAPL